LKGIAVKTTLRLAFALVVSLVMTANAPAWCHRTAMAPVYPAMPVMPYAPAVGGMSFNMSMAASGDPAMLLMGPLMLRQLISGFLGSPAVNATETQLLTALPKILPLLGVPPMTADQIAGLFKELHDTREAAKTMQDSMKGMQDSMKGMQDSMKTLQTAMEDLTKAIKNAPKPPGGPNPPSPAAAQARAEVKRLLAEIKTMPGNPATAAPALVASQRSTAELRAEVKQLLAEIKAMPTGPQAPRGATVASRGN